MNSRTAPEGGPKIAIVCAGAVGSHVGGHLTRAGYAPILVDFWPEHVDAMRRDGLKLTGVTEAECFTQPVEAWHITELERLSRERPVDIAFVCAKSYDTVWATEMIRQYLAPDGFVVSLQNGINEERVAGVVGWGKTMGSIASLIAVELHAPGEVRRNVQLGGGAAHRLPRGRTARPDHGPRAARRGDAGPCGQRDCDPEPLGRALVEAGRQLHAQSDVGGDRPRWR